MPIPEIGMSVGAIRVLNIEALIEVVQRFLRTFSETTVPV